MRMAVQLYGLGSNGAGQLGCGHLDDLSEPQLCRFVDGGREDLQSDEPPFDHLSEGDDVKKLVAGGNHTLVLTAEGRLYASGNNVDGRCGVADSPESLTVFTVIDWAKGRNITDCAATWEASLFVEDAHVVWSCGSGSKGELGLGEGCMQSRMPSIVFDSRQVEDGCTVVDISGSMSHVIMVLSNGEVYGWGSCRRAQLGAALQARKILWKPHRIEVSFSVAGAISGRDFSFCWSSKGEKTLLGDLKIDDGNQNLSVKSENCQLYAGWSTIYTLDQGIVSGHGPGRRGQLPPATLPYVEAMAAGSEHCVALTEDGNVAAWGWGEHGNCGIPLDDRGNVHNRFNRVPVPSQEEQKIVGVGAGCATSFAWTNTHR